MSVAEVVIANQQIPGLHLVMEPWIERPHRNVRELFDILNLDVLDAYDLIDIEVDVFEYPRHAANEIFKTHANRLTDSVSDR